MAQKTNKKPIYKRAWFIALVVIVVLAIIGAGSNDDKESESKKIGEVSPSATMQSIEITTPVAEVQTVYSVGDILHGGDMDIVYVASGEYNEDNEFMQPNEGYKYIFLKLAFINTSDTSDTNISSFGFECYADGYACDSYYGGEDDLSATLSAGRSTIGYIYFEVPVDSQTIEVEYDTNYFTADKITFAYGGNQDSGYVLEKNTNSTEGALAVGESTESKELKITYLSCYEDYSDNMFITPKDGYHYITCEFEFENLSDSDEYVSYLSFDSFADGMSCDLAYFRDDTLSATISSGRKAKGTVTFEVPVDATTIEFEYVTNYWTSNRVVFDASIF